MYINSFMYPPAPDGTHRKVVLASCFTFAVSVCVCWLKIGKPDRKIRDGKKEFTQTVPSRGKWLVNFCSLFFSSHTVRVCVCVCAG